RRTLAALHGPVVAIAARRSRVVSASPEGTIRIWDLARGGEPRTLEGLTNTTTLSLAEKGDRALVGSTKSIVVRDLDGWEVVKPDLTVVAGVLPSDGGRGLLATNAAVMIMDFGEPMQTVLRQESATAVAADAAFRLGASAGADGVVRIWDLVG